MKYLFVSPRREAVDKTATQEVPPINEDKEDDLKGQGDHDGREHHHAHGHQNGGNNKIDN